MSLAPGSRFGPYELVAALGAGGMGEVYRARDVKLNRDVAIKVLPEAFHRDADRLARFKREAQVLASLSHPHIGQIYGIEDTNGVPALVLELVDGPTLSDRLERSAPAGLPAEEALAIASQIADALDAAHERGIVHRDLKPANIKITPDGVVKVLDFGLAKMADPETGTEPPLSHSPTLTVRGGTRDGMLLGTAAYMSPEQARGHVVDKRADVWAFGCVLYEMLTGQSPFARATLTDTLVAILEHKPDWTRLPAATPVPVRRLIERCLAKDPRQRLRDLGDARLDLADAVSPPAGPIHQPANAPGPSARWRWIAAIAGTAVLTSAAWSLRPRSAPAPELSRVTRLVIGAPSGDRIMLDAGAIALSPDGRRLAYVAGRGSHQQIYIREFDQFESKAVPGTEGGYNPFLSPDGQWLGFFTGGKLKKVRPGVGEPVTIGDALIGSGTPTWETDDTILFTPVIGSGIMRIPAAGGTPTPVTTLAADESAHQWPQLLPGGKTLLFSAVGVGGAQIYLQSLETGQRRKLVQGLGARYLPSGHLVFLQGGTVMAVPFDTGSMDVNGTPVPVLSGVLHANRLRNTASSSLLPQISVASGGTLAFVPANTGRRMSELVWVDSSGAERPTGASGGDYFQPRVSPDGRRVAVVVGGDHDDVWLFDLARQTWSRLTSDGNNSFPVWSPDGNRLVFVSDRAGVENMYARNIGGNTDDRLLVSPRANYSLSMARDGTLAFVLVKVGQAQDIWIQRPDQRDKPVPWLETPFSEGGAAFAPDGRWLAYVSNESGRNEIYVRPHPGPGEQLTISTGGGNEPLWARDGRQLFYRNGDAMFAVDVQGTPALAAGKPRKLFEKDYERTSSLWQNYDVSPDGQRFLMIRTIDDKGPAQIQVVLNWAEELRQRVPAAGSRAPER